MIKKIQTIFILLLTLSLYSEEFKGFSRQDANILNKLMNGKYKLYYCDNCPKEKAEIIIVNQLSYKSNLNGDKNLFNLIVNNNLDLDSKKLYIQSENEWVNILAKLGYKTSFPEILPEKLYPIDPEIEADKELSTPGEIPYLNLLENKLCEDINLIRSNPSEFSKKINLMLPYINGNVFSPPGRRPTKLSGSKASYIELIKKLESLEPVNKLNINEHLSEGVKVNRLNDSKKIWEMYRSYIERPEFLNVYELSHRGVYISYEIILNLLVSNWSNYSKYLFDSDYEYLGISCGKDNQEINCKLLFASTLELPLDIKKSLEDYETKSNIEYLTVLEKEIIDETNFLRTNPKKYAEFLKDRRKYYFGNKLKFPKLAVWPRKEGIKALEEAISILEKMESLPALKINKNLSLSSLDHVKDTGPKNIEGHFGSDGSSPAKRITKHIEKIKIAGENIAYGHFSARNIVIELFVDDGIYDRGHRKNLLNQEFENIGVSCGPHVTYRIMCVQNFGTW